MHEIARNATGAAATPPIDMQFNYPVLPGQDEELARLLQQSEASATDLLAPRGYGGHTDDREAGAAWISRQGIDISAERVVLCAGGHHAVYISLLAAGLRGGKVAADALTYPGFKMQAASLGIDLLPCSADSDGMLPEELERAADAGAQAIFLMPTVQNPLGTVMPLARRMELCDVAQRRNLWMIDDDAYHFIEAAPPPSFAALAPELAFTVRSLTKPVAPVMKLAYLVFPERLSAEVIAALRFTSSGVSSVLAKMASRMVHDGSMQRLIEAKRVEGAARLAKAKEILSGINLRAHPNAFHFWIDLPPEKFARSVADALLADGVLVSQSDDFVATSAVAANGLRVALGADPDAERRETALRHLRTRVLE
jgi:DNA-binding transcriptional MocR family regulator